MTTSMGGTSADRAEIGLAPVMRTRFAQLSMVVRPRVVGVSLGLLAVVAIVGSVSLFTGSYSVAPGDVLRIVVGDYAGMSPFDVATVLDNRLARFVCAALAGAALGLSGALFQGVTGNPLGSPDIIGFTGGAATGAVAALLWAPAAALGIAVGAAAIGGGLVTAAVVLALSWRHGVSGYRLILIGIAITAALGAARDWLVSRADLSDAQASYRWLIGSLHGRSWDDLGLFLVLGTLLLIPTLRSTRPLDLLSCGEEVAAAQGIAVARARIGIVILGTAWCALAVTITGPLGFVAFAAPHIARSLTWAPGPLLVSSALAGSAALALADAVAMRLLAPTQLATGIVTGLVGGAYLLFTLIRPARSSHAAHAL